MKSNPIEEETKNLVWITSKDTQSTDIYHK